MRKFLFMLSEKYFVKTLDKQWLFYNPGSIIIPPNAMHLLLFLESKFNQVDEMLWTDL